MVYIKKFRRRTIKMKSMDPKFLCNMKFTKKHNPIPVSPNYLSPCFVVTRK